MYSEKAKYDQVLKAVLVDDKTNIKKNKLYEIYKCKDGEYKLIIEPKIDGYKVYNAILKKFNQKDKSIDVDFDSFLSIVKDERYVNRLIMSLYSALHYSSSIPYTTKTTKQNALKFNLFGSNIKKYKKTLDEVSVVAEAQTFTRTLQDMPSGIMYPEAFVKEVQKQFSSLGSKVKITVLDKNELTKKKMFSLLGVGQGATLAKNTPRLLVIEYNGNPKSKQRYGYVGKGVCFDTGGYNIKTGTNMRWMKFDMSGAAIVSGAIYALAKNNIETNVCALCPLVLNLISETAQKPDDIVETYLGKTVEIDNTDAEGRLILIDAITYAAKDLKVDKIFEVSTLTGAMIYSLGETYTGTWSTNDETWCEVLEAAKQAGEQVWRLPLHDEFIAMLKSNIADLSNSCNGPAAGSSRAACFLKEFAMDKPFVHFDVAATADKGNVGTGVILRTLYNISSTKKRLS